MPRTKGAKDLKPRRMNPASLDALPTSLAGFVSASVRIYAPTPLIRWFQQLDSRQHRRRLRRLHADRGLQRARQLQLYRHVGRSDRDGERYGERRTGLDCLAVLPHGFRA